MLVQDVQEVLPTINDDKLVISQIIMLPLFFSKILRIWTDTSTRTDALIHQSIT